MRLFNNDYESVWNLFNHHSHITNYQKGNLSRTMFWQHYTFVVLYPFLCCMLLMLFLLPFWPRRLQNQRTHTQNQTTHSKSLCLNSNVPSSLGDIFSPLWSFWRTYEMQQYDDVNDVDDKRTFNAFPSLEKQKAIILWCNVQVWTSMVL